MAATRGEMFAGVTVALVTPFRGGDIDWDDLGKLVDWHVDRGPTASPRAAPPASPPTLTHDENERVVAFVCERARGRLKVMAGTGSNNTAEAVRMTKAAKRAGADGTLQVGPYYNKPSQEGYFRHFMAVADACDLPQVIYNIPGRTASAIFPETLARLAEACPAVVAVKEATGSLDSVSQVLALTDLTVLSGDDSLTLPLMSVGGKGVVSVVGNLVPRDMTALVRAFAAGDVAGAQEWQPQAVPALPGPARGGHQPDPGQDGHEAARPGQRRAAAADVPAGRRRRSPHPADADGLRVAVRPAGRTYIESSLVPDRLGLLS
jgi:4-hydroxy-tetrahydrodipicolinate synthase